MYDGDDFNFEPSPRCWIFDVLTITGIVGLFASAFGGLAYITLKLVGLL